jgi:hypothetical protein
VRDIDDSERARTNGPRDIEEEKDIKEMSLWDLSMRKEAEVGRKIWLR